MGLDIKNHITLKTLYELRDSLVSWDSELQERIVNNAIDNAECDKQHFIDLFAEKDMIRIFLMMIDERIDNL